MAAYIVLRFQAPMMSFGEGDWFDVRGTNTFPTKSAIVGFLACCQGIRRDEEERIRELSESIKITVRQDMAPIIIRDFQTVLATVNSNGNIVENPLVSPRHYLGEAAFTIWIRVDNEALLAKLEKALKDPQWIPYLGRKSCPPSYPFYETTLKDTSLREAIEKVPPLTSDDLALSQHKDRETRKSENTYLLWSEEEGEFPNTHPMELYDEVISPVYRTFRKRKLYFFELPAEGI